MLIGVNGIYLQTMEITPNRTTVRFGAVFSRQIKPSV